MADALVTQLARALNLSPDSARHTLNHLVAALREQIDATGEAAVPGLGTFHRDGEQLAFTPDDALARAVNHRYAGLRPISAGPGRPQRPAKEEPPAAEFQPLEAFIEPAEPEAHDLAEPDDEQPNAAIEPDSDADAASLPDAALSDDAETETEDVLPFAVAEASAEAPADEVDEPDDEAESAEIDEPIAEQEPEDEESAVVAEPEDSVDEELVEAEEPAVEEEPVAESSDVDELLAETWIASDETNEEHPLGVIPDDAVEGADYAVVEPERGETSDELDSDELDTDASTETPDEETVPDEALTDEALEAEDDEPLVEEVAAFGAVEPPPVTEAPPEPRDEPPAPTVAPAVAATSIPRPADRPPVEKPRRSNAWVFGGLAVVLFVALGALLWSLRDDDGPVVAERTPVPADTFAAVPPPADTSSVAADTAAVATVPEPEPPAPAPSADPLRSTAGIDRADGGFSWIVASEFSREPAERRVATFRDQGFRADVIAEEANGRTRYRVALGQFSSIEEADRFRSDLPAGVPPDTWLLRL